jgi:hypothetical protein
MDEPVQASRNLPRSFNWRLCLAPAGGAIAAVCFFLPWGRFSFLVMHKSASGHTVGGSAWVIFALAAIAMVAGVVLPRLRRPASARAVVFSVAVLGLLCFVFKANALARGVWTPFGRIQPQDIGVKPGLGGQGTAVGFLLAIVGSFFLPGPRPRWLPAWRALTRRNTPVESRPPVGRPIGNTPPADASIRDTPVAGGSIGNASAAGPPPDVDLRGSSGAGGEGTA